MRLVRISKTNLQCELKTMGPLRVMNGNEPDCWIHILRLASGHL
jgi:hypothetical protein